MVPSQFAANHYRQALGLTCVVLPNLIDFKRVHIENHEPRYVPFINPSLEKGVYAFARMADELGRIRPDIPLLVVEGRGTERTLADCGVDLRIHRNVFFMSHTHDPGRFWKVTRLRLMPSLWWENQPLVAIEAMINGIPVVASNRGGLPETLGEAGVTLPLPERLTRSSRVLPTAEEVAPWIEALVKIWDDRDNYARHRAIAVIEALRWSPRTLLSEYTDFFNNLRFESSPTLPTEERTTEG